MKSSNYLTASATISVKKLPVKRSVELAALLTKVQYYLVS